MLNPNLTSPFTADIYKAIEKEITRLSDEPLCEHNSARMKKLKRWKAHLEDTEAMFVEMKIARFPPKGPLLL